MILTFVTLQVSFNILLLKLGVKWIRLWNSSWNFEFSVLIWNDFFVHFGNGYFHNVVCTLTNVVKLDFEKDITVSTLSNVVHINVEIRNDNSTLFDVFNYNVEINNGFSALIWRWPTSRRHINQKTTLKQRWKVFWVKSVNLASREIRTSSLIPLVYQNPIRTLVI